MPLPVALPGQRAPHYLIANDRTAVELARAADPKLSNSASSAAAKRYLSVAVNAVLEPTPEEDMNDTRTDTFTRLCAFSAALVFAVSDSVSL